MFLEEENPTIRQTIFIINSQLSYQFDVNQTIQLHQLKKMIAAAARLRKNSFSLYSDGIDYTNNDDDRLMNLFPGQQIVKFNLLKGEPEDLDQSTVKIRIDQYCPKHELKYLSYYCYTCHKSVCSLCVHDKEHQGHNFREKYDYLQNSKYLVDAAFKNDMSFNKDPKKSYQVSNDLTVLKTQLKNTMFKTLYDMLAKVEGRLEDLVDKYNSINKTSCDNLQDNTILIKKYCTKGLDELKESIGITDIIIDEDVFLTFDKKYNELYNIHSGRFASDVNKFNELNKSMVKPIQDLVDKTYNDIYNVLADKLKMKEIDMMKSTIESKLVKPITEQEVIGQITNVNNDSKGAISKPYLNFSKEISKATKNVSQKDLNPQHDKPYNTTTNQQSSLFKPLSDNPFINPSISQNDNPFLVNNPLIMQGPTNPNNPFMNPQVPINSFGPLYTNTPTPNEDVTMTPTPANIQTSNSAEYIMAQVKSTNTVKILDQTGMKTKVVNFPLILGTNSFFIYSSHCNNNGFLYVSGGVEIVGSTISSSTMFKYDCVNNSIVRLANMNIPRHNHTMISQGSYIYVVGGLNNSTAERYDTRFNIWTKLSPLVSERQNPILFIHNNYLYAFFGKASNGRYLETIERLNISENVKNAQWEIVNYSNPDKVNVKVYGCAVSEVEGSLFFFSGVREDKPVNSIFLYDFEDKMITSNEQVVDWKESFEENVLFKIGEYFGQISDKSYNSISLQLTS